MFSGLLLEHFQNPRNVGDLEGPDARIEVSNPVCGDILRLSVRLRDGLFSEVRYQTRGCTAAIAVGSALTELLRGKSPSEARQLSRDAVEAAVGGLPNESKHAAALALDAVRSLLAALESPRVRL
jgi:nitrogen fixation NifU-like protein